MPTESVSTTNEIPADALEILELPDLSGLTADQVRGADCVWCKTRLTAETAVYLGEHMSPLDGSGSERGMRWFPRSCRRCTANRAHEGLFTHAPMCEQCVDEPGGCEVSRWLYRLVRENRR